MTTVSATADFAPLGRHPDVPSLLLSDSTNDIGPFVRGSDADGLLINCDASLPAFFADRIVSRGFFRPCDPHQNDIAAVMFWVHKIASDNELAADLLRLHTGYTDDRDYAEAQSPYVDTSLLLHDDDESYHAILAINLLGDGMEFPACDHAPHHALFRRLSHMGQVCDGAPDTIAALRAQQLDALQEQGISLTNLPVRHALVTVPGRAPFLHGTPVSNDRASVIFGLRHP